MGMGKYYCDYCSKQFQDTPFARKRHLQSLSHHNAKALWFDSFRSDPSGSAHGTPPLLLCNRLLTTGFCHFGDSCNFFHPNNNNNPQNWTSTPANSKWIGTSLTGTRSWGNLPPSLMPPPDSGGYPPHPLPFLDWG